MSTVMTEQPQVLPDPAPGDPRRAMVALARVEAVRLLRHPVTIAGILLFVGPELYGWLSGGANRYPVLQDEDRSKQFLALLALGGAALIAANLAALRAHRHATTVLYDTFVLPQPWRTGAFLLSVVPFGLLVAVLVAVRIGLLAAVPGAAGRPNPYELAAYPAAVLLLGAAGVLLARLVRAVIVAPLLLLVLAVVTVAGLLPSTPAAARLRWLLPIAMDEPPMPLPVDLMSRPAGWHLAYVVGLIVLVAAAALAVTGARGRRLVAAGAAGLSITVLAGSAQFFPTSDAVRTAQATAAERPAEMQSCQRIDQVTYCAFDDFAPWVGGWDAVVRGVLRRVPEAQARQPLAVRQRISTADRAANGLVVTAEEQAAAAAAWRRVDADAGTPNAVTVGTRWGDGESEIGFAGLVAYEVVARAGGPAGGQVCGARGVLVGWLAGQATPKATDGLREVDANSWGGVPFGEWQFPVALSVPDREMAVALALLKRPADEVAELVRRSWAELSAAGTPTERAGELFGVAVAPLPPEEERTVCEA
ncbi:hypothetical protein E1193_06355 [Micromonospora sp. KC606]|uniref:hypothetical protein n=1 Tax=Micromonospora sp. KC606 TaxID=2530379 RepID=UPI001044A2A6|nr:hypothetical protein [Micromonospora sp. KC606]TDC84196.1 hypothetical protein E1193_06355 [Micromonospora sp. KC606]